MDSPIADPQVEAAFCAVSDAVVALGGATLDPGDVEGAYALCRRLEVIGRRVQALQLELLSEIERQGLHRADGHASTKVLVRHAANLSNAEAARRHKSARALQAMPLVAAAFRAGDIGRCQVDRVAATHANPRVREAFERQDANVSVLATRLPFVELDRKLVEWEQLEDADGAGDDAERNHRRRDFAVRTNVDGSKRIEGGCGALQGEEVASIHDHFVKLEWEGDWAEARERLGDAATVADLRRTDAQRRMDGAHAAFRAAAGAQAAAGGGSTIVTNVVMDHETFQRELRRMAGDHPGHDDRADSILDPDASQSSDPAAFRSATIDASPVPPAEIAAAALIGRVRRVVIGADGVVLDMGRLRRLFTGPLRTAVQLSSPTCVWTGCHVPASQCQADHLDAFNGPRHGSTHPGNGAPLCGRHNRYKERGFTVTRDPCGQVTVQRPDGSEIR